MSEDYVVFEGITNCKEHPTKRIAVRLDQILGVEEIHMEETPDPDTVITVERASIHTSFMAPFITITNFHKTISMIEEAFAIDKAEI